jgi:hypothetical protein
VIRDPASWSASNRDELRDRSLSPKQCLKHTEACGVPKDPEIPRLSGLGQHWRKGIATVG